MTYEAHCSVIGFVATQPRAGYTKSGSRSVSMRVGWTPRSMDKDTGVWSDQPSSFITVNCYKKVAEHVAVCLRRGDPIVVRGTMRVREYIDKNGQRRTSVEVTADSIGHDLSRGISVFNRAQARSELTAFEYEQAQAQAAGAGRSPLPGDLSAATQDGGQGLGRHPDEADELEDDDDLAGDAGFLAGDADASELAALEGMVESEARMMMADLADASEPVGASA